MNTPLTKLTGIGVFLIGAVVLIAIVSAYFVQWKSEINLQARTRHATFISRDILSVNFPGCQSSETCLMIADSPLPISPFFTLEVAPGTILDISSFGPRILFAIGAATAKSAAKLTYYTATSELIDGQPGYGATEQILPPNTRITFRDVSTVVKKDDFLTLTFPASTKFQIGSPTRVFLEPVVPMLLDGKAQFLAHMSLPFLPEPGFLVQEQELMPGDFVILDNTAAGAKGLPVSGLVRVTNDGVMLVRARGMTDALQYEGYGGEKATLLSSSLLGVLLAHPFGKLLLAALAALSALWGIPKFLGRSE